MARSEPKSPARNRGVCSGARTWAAVAGDHRKWVGESRARAAVDISRGCDSIAQDARSRSERARSLRSRPRASRRRSRRVRVVDGERPRARVPPSARPSARRRDPAAPRRRSCPRARPPDAAPSRGARGPGGARRRGPVRAPERPTDATKKEIKAAYKIGWRSSMPRREQGAGRAERFNEVKQAYQTLSDEDPTREASTTR